MNTPNTSLADEQPRIRRDVVACVVRDGADVCLVRRSALVSHDRGRWHCVTGYLERRTQPSEAMLAELSEELGLTADRVDALRAGQVLRYVDDRVVWVVHTFVARTRQRRFRLNWENDSYAWVRNRSVPHPQVWWLADVCRSVGVDELEGG